MFSISWDVAPGRAMCGCEVLSSVQIDNHHATSQSHAISHVYRRESLSYPFTELDLSYDTLDNVGLIRFRNNNRPISSTRCFTLPGKRPRCPRVVPGELPEATSAGSLPGDINCPCDRYCPLAA